MIAQRPAPIVAPADLARCFLAVGLVPLLLVLDRPPWSFTLTPGWSVQQLAVIAVAGVGLGLLPGRPAQGIAAVALGSLIGLGFDLWWLAGWVKPYDQDFVTTLGVDAWRSSLLWAALALWAVVSAGFVAGVIVSRQVRRDFPAERPRLTRAEATALGFAVIGVPLLAAGLATTAASSGLVAADDVQTQSVWISRDAIALDPLSLRPGPTRFRCHVAPDATREWARLIARPEGGSGQALPAFPEDFSACSAYEPGSEVWGTVADLRPGRYVWAQYAYGETSVRPITMSPAFVVGP